jgi:hypothetical protein
MPRQRPRRPAPVVRGDRAQPHRPGLSVAGGEWILGPLAIGTEGWVEIGFVALISILLHALYNVPGDVVTQYQGVQACLLFAEPFG